jgi:glc operon protein GlcG
MTKLVKNMTLELAQRAVTHALQLAEKGRHTISVSVVDKSGFLVAFAKMDGVKLLTIHLTHHKAYTAARMEVSTDAFLARLQRDNLEIAYFGDEKFTALPGGVPILVGGELIGAVGIGGITTEMDQEIAEHVAHAFAKQTGPVGTKEKSHE